MGKKILIVDDTEDNLFLMKAMLKKSDSIELTTALSGKRALELLKETDFDLIFLDINMPEMDGFETLDNIRSFESSEGRNTTKIYAFTASTSKDDVNKITAAGFDKHLSKPINKQTLIQSIEES